MASFPPRPKPKEPKDARGVEDKIDLALANWLVIADLPPYKDLTRDQYFAMLDETTNRVRGMIEQARRNPLMAGDLNDPARLAHVFCSAMIALGIDYVDEFKVYTEGPGDAFSFLLNTGTRKSEMFALQWSDVDFNAKTVRLVGSKNAKNGKSAKSRYVPMNGAKNCSACF